MLGKSHMWRRHGGSNVPLPYLPLCISFICLFLSSILNNLVIVFPWVLGRVIENYWTWERSCETPDLYSQLVRSTGARQPGPLGVASEAKWGTVSRDWALIYGVCANFGPGMSEMNEITGHLVSTDTWNCSVEKPTHLMSELLLSRKTMFSFSDSAKL